MLIVDNLETLRRGRARRATYVGFFLSILTLGVNLRGAAPEEEEEVEEVGGPPWRRDTKRSGPFGASGLAIGKEPNLEGATLGLTRGAAGADEEGAGGAPLPLAPPFGAGCILQIEVI